MRYVAPSALAILMIVGCNTAPPELAAGFPVRNEARAISIAKYVCRRETVPGLQWRASFIASKRKWIVDTEPSVHKSGDPLRVVDIPIDGPLPSLCQASLYDLVGP
ncbi:hypothetical protein GCM10022276_12520 [Sphingomonas limnosediminicola]|uniref:Uncharacterized protein n=1 Tax=Sphingomonas limnosediminicola TaxID=940133 RepID=A0ABP7L679_9SPHN